MKQNVEMEGARQTLAAFRNLPKEASKELRQQSKEIVTNIIPRIQSAASSDVSPQSHLLSPTVRPKSDRVPAIQVGGTKRVGSRRSPAHAVLFGSEFGSDRFDQFHKSHTGKTGSWFFPAVENEAEMVKEAWNKAADETVKKFSEGVM